MKKLTELQREQIKTAKLFLEEIRALAEQTERTLLTTTFIVNGKKYQYNTPTIKPTAMKAIKPLFLNVFGM